MHAGIFAKTFRRDTLDGVLDAVVEHGFDSVQFNMACAGLPSIPESIPDGLPATVREGFEQRGLNLCALSATFNAIHPDPAERERGVRRFEVLARHAREMGTDFLTLCTGTRDSESMWRHHSDNASPEAWGDLRQTMLRLLSVAEKHDLRLGIEPEVSNVVDSPLKAARLLDELGSPRVRIIMDGANIFRSEDLPRMDEVLKEAFDLLGPRISLAHAKDVSNERPPHYGAAGTGVLDYALYVRLLGSVGYDGPLVLHSLSEEQVPSSLAYVRSFLEQP